MTYDWRRDAECRHMENVRFFPDKGHNDILAASKAVCRECPVITECLDYALHNERFGVWGGTSEKQRRIMRRVQGIEMRRPEALFRMSELSQCGTNAGYQRHARAGEDPCTSCRRAHSNHQSMYYEEHGRNPNTRSTPVVVCEDQLATQKPPHRQQPTGGVAHTHERGTNMDDSIRSSVAGVAS